MKKNIYLILLAATLISCNSNEISSPTISEEISSEEISSEEISSVDELENLEFPISSSEYSLNLAKSALLLSNYAQDLDEEKEYLASIGYDYQFSKNYSKDTLSLEDSCAYAFFSKKINIGNNTKNLYLVPIRWTTGGEWTSNFNINNSLQPTSSLRYVEGAYTSALETLEDIKDIKNKDNNAIFFIYGHSRGAAISNILGTLVDDYYGMDDFYIYTSATPTTIFFDGSSYTNIFNLINESDIVPQFAPTFWGTRRAGTDICFTSSLKSKQFIEEKMAGLQELIPTIDEYYNEKHAINTSGLDEDGLNYACVGSYIAYFLGRYTKGYTDYLSINEFLNIEYLAEDSDLAKVLDYFTKIVTDDYTIAAATFLQHAPNIYIAYFS